MTVAELITMLESIEDKSQLVVVPVGEEGLDPIDAYERIKVVPFNEPKNWTGSLEECYTNTQGGKSAIRLLTDRWNYKKE